VTDIIK